MIRPIPLRSSMLRQIRFRPIASLIALALAGICVALPVRSQAPTSAPPAPQPAASQAGPSAAALPSSPAPQQDSSAITTIRTYTNLVVIDVVVSDSKGNPVHNLKQSDFTLTENGKPQYVKSFEEHTALPPSETAKIAPATGPVRPGVFTNKTAAPANGPVNVLLLDYLNTPLTAGPFVRKQLTDFLNKAPEGARIAIFALTSNLTMLQGFTSDPAVLKAALNSKKGAAQASEVLNDPVNGGSQTNTTLSDNFSSDAVDAAQQLANIEREQALSASFQQDLRAKYTLGAFEELARFLVGIPGRKNVIWFSGSFPLSIEPDTNLQDPFDSVVRNDEEIRKTDNLLTRAQIAVYPVDARGVFNDPSKSAAVGGVGITGNSDFSTVGTAANNDGPGIAPVSQSQADANSQMDFLQQSAQEHETMYAMAEDTGGHAFVNSNNLSLAVQQAISNGSNYYTLTYTPSNTQWDGKFRAIKVKVEQSGVKLAYREGYYADDPNDRNRNIAGSAALAMARPTTMSTAMMHGGPDQTEIPFKVRIRPSAAPPDDKPAPNDVTNPDPKVGVTGPYKDYGVDLVPDPHAVSCSADDTGTLHCAIEVATYVYDRTGVLLVTTSARTRTALTPANYAEMLHTGIAFHEEISVPVKGQYYLRTAIHDLTSDRVGATEVPVASVAHLPPLDAPPAAPAASLDDMEKVLDRKVGAGSSASAPGGSSVNLETLMPGLATPAATAPASTPASAPAPMVTGPAATPAVAPSAPLATPR